MSSAGEPSRRFDFYGCGVEVASADPSLVDEVRRDFLYFVSDAPGERPAVRIEMRLEAPDYTDLPAVPATIVTPRNVCFRDGHTTYLDYFGRALAVFDRKSSRFSISGTDRDLVHEAVYLFVLSTVGQHLDRIGLHRIHALGVRHRGGAVLVLMPSGGGKSTLALELLGRPGFDLLSEDTPLMDRSGRLRPFPLRLGIRPEREVDIPARYLRTVKRMEFDPKTLIDLDYFEGSVCEPDAVVEPRLVLVGERNLGRTTAIEPLNRARALGAFVKYGVVGLGVYQGLEFLLERGVWELAGRTGTVASRLYASGRLLAKAPAHRFVLGRDVAANTRRLLEFLEADG